MKITKIKDRNVAGSAILVVLVFSSAVLQYTVIDYKTANRQGAQ